MSSDEVPSPILVVPQLGGSESRAYVPQNKRLLWEQSKVTQVDFVKLWYLNYHGTAHWEVSLCFLSAVQGYVCVSLDMSLDRENPHKFSTPDMGRFEELTLKMRKVYTSAASLDSFNVNMSNESMVTVGDIIRLIDEEKLD